MLTGELRAAIDTLHTFSTDPKRPRLNASYEGMVTRLVEGLVPAEKASETDERSVDSDTASKSAARAASPSKPAVGAIPPASPKTAQGTASTSASMAPPPSDVVFQVGEQVYVGRANDDAPKVGNVTITGVGADGTYSVRQVLQ